MNMTYKIWGDGTKVGIFNNGVLYNTLEVNGKVKQLGDNLFKDDEGEFLISEKGKRVDVE